MALKAARSKSLGMVVALALSQLTCTTTDNPSAELEAPPPPLVLAPVQDVPSATVAKEAEPDLAPAMDLGQLTEGNPTWRRAVADLMAIVAAEDADRLQQYDKGKDDWRKALLTARGVTGKLAFEGWVASYAQSLKTLDEDVLTRLLLAESEAGQKFPYMLQQGLGEKSKLSARVHEILRRRGLISEAKQTSIVVLPEAGRLPLHDLSLEKTAQRVCDKSVANQAALDAWIVTFPTAVSTYWHALVARCEGRRSEARRLMRQATESLAGKKAWASLNVRAYELRLVLEREEGDRAAMADTYLGLLKAFTAPGVRAEDYGEEPFDFALREIDATLSAARYRSLVNDYVQAKSLIQDAFRLVKATGAKFPRRSLSQRHKLAELHADAYHTLAFRVAIEQGDVAAALESTRLGLQNVSDLPTDWRERLQWASGLYLYLLGQGKEAVQVWQSLLAVTKNEGLKPQLAFWVARAARDSGDTVLADEHVAKLFSKYPVHFYTVVASQEAGMAPAGAWSNLFRNLAELKQRFAVSQELSQGLLRRDTELARLLLRAELVLKVQDARFSPLLTQELHQALRRKYRVNAETRDAFVYVSRLLYQAGEFNESIGLTSSLANALDDFWERYPEQIIAYFPQPFAKVYRERASLDFLEPETLLAITRQESGFRPKVLSPAGAIGLMQLMPATAESVAVEKDMPKEGIIGRLMNPEGNIALGSGYIRRLSRHYPGRKAEVYAAYNAGEYAVDVWLKTRPRKDLLAWIELTPFMETREYTKNVWRNAAVYRFLMGFDAPIAMAHADRPIYP